MSTTFQGWAIDTREPDGRLLGVGWFGWPCDGQDHLGVCRTALFETRRKAKESMLEKHVRSGYPRARVVHVTLTIRVRR